MHLKPLVTLLVATCLMPVSMWVCAVRPVCPKGDYDRNKLHQQWRAYHMNGRPETDFMLQPYISLAESDTLLHLQTMANGTQEGSSLSHNQQRHCPRRQYRLHHGARGGDGDNREVNERAVCPWYTFVSKDTSRYPPSLTETRCRCSRCRQMHGNCEPVHYFVRVLRQTSRCDSTGHVEYKQSWHRLTIGCTCAHARTS